MEPLLSAKPFQAKVQIWHSYMLPGAMLGTVQKFLRWGRSWGYARLDFYGVKRIRLVLHLRPWLTEEIGET